MLQHQGIRYSAEKALSLIFGSFVDSNSEKEDETGETDEGYVLCQVMKQIHNSKAELEHENEDASSDNISSEHDKGQGAIQAAIAKEAV